VAASAAPPLGHGPIGSSHAALQGVAPFEVNPLMPPGHCSPGELLDNALICRVEGYVALDLPSEDGLVPI
jgi:hypothetical protein